MNTDTISRSLLDFIAASPTAFQAVENVAAELLDAGYRELLECRSWDVRPGDRCFVRRNGSSLIAFRLPETEFSGFMIMAAHSDSPSFRIKENSDVRSGLYTQLNVEKYGGMICSSWLDRPLSIAGRAVIRKDGGMKTVSVDLDRDLLIIPSVAIHMDRSVNEGKSFNANVDMLPLLGSAETETGLKKLLSGALCVPEEDILSTEVYLYPRTKGTVLGAENEYICSPRLDDLQCAWACLQGLLQAEKCSAADVLCIFDNEEVGSGTKQGADSGFLEDVLQRLCEALGKTPAEYRQYVASSFMVSADNAHAVHPNHPEYADRNDRPELNKGIVIKFNAAQRYTTDAVSAAAFREICAAADVPVQSFTNRSDLPGGSTLGNISSAHVSLYTVDIGLPQLAMHSAYETAGVKDTEYLIRAAKEFYGRSFSIAGNKIEI